MDILHIGGTFGYYLRMVTDGLIGKLLTSGIAEKLTEEIKFTNRFLVHVALYSKYIRSKGASVNSWREMLGAFDPTLISFAFRLSDYLLYLQIQNSIVVVELAHNHEFRACLQKLPWTLIVVRVQPCCPFLVNHD